MTETPDPIWQQASRQPDAPALVHGRTTLTYHDLHFLIERAAARIRASHVAAGDRVAVVVEPTLPCITAILALLRLGAAVCALNSKQPQLVLIDQLKRLKPKLLISAGLVIPPSFVPAISFGDLESTAEFGHTRLLADAWPLDRHATIIYTSGSTSQPKAAVHTWGNHYYSAIGSAENIPFGPGDRWLLTLPLYHVGGLAILFRAIICGGCVVIPEDRDRIIEALSEHAITHVSLVATQLYWLFREPETLAGAQHSLKAILLGGGPISDSLVTEACEAGLPVFTSYGMTEMSSQITTTPPGALPEKIGSSGKILPHRELRIDDNSQILVRGKVLFAGYLEDDGIRQPVDKKGWFDTGDLGNLDENGFLRVSGRKDNLIISGGENIQVEEIECALRELPGVQDAVVVGVPDEEFGERPVAIVQVDPAHPLDSERLHELLLERLPKFKLPEFIFHTTYPGEGRGLKADRRRLSELARRMFHRRHD